MIFWDYLGIFCRKYRNIHESKFLIFLINRIGFSKYLNKNKNKIHLNIFFNLSKNIFFKMQIYFCSFIILYQLTLVNLLSGNSINFFLLLFFTLNGALIWNIQQNDYKCFKKNMLFFNIKKDLILKIHLKFINIWRIE